jgi:hypothetical protein
MAATVAAASRSEDQTTKAPPLVWGGASLSPKQQEEFAMTRLIKASALAALSMFLIHASLHAQETTMSPKSSKSAKSECAGKSTITNADGKDGENNSGPNSGNGGKGGTIKNPCLAKDGNVSANGGNGGSNNKGGNSGNGGKGGTIEF